MYGFDNDRFLNVMNGAVGNIDQINKIADSVSKKGFNNIYLLGTGGTYAILSPLAYFLKTNSNLMYYHDIAAEVVASKPKSLTKNSLIITASLSGTTKETIELVEYANSVGATTIGFVGNAETPLGKSVTYCVENDAENDNLVEELHVQLFALGARLMRNNVSVG